MRRVHPTGSFKKDLRRISKRGWDLDALNDVVTLLQRNVPLPKDIRPHKLTGEWKGFWECHIGPDWLLIYTFSESEVLLARTGSHADLFE